MKKTLLIIILLVTSCEAYDTDAEKLNKMASPVIVKTIGESGWEHPTVLLQDGNGNLYEMQSIIFQNVNVGDTIK